MTAYLGHFQSPVGMVIWGFLVYPFFDPSKPDTHHAEQNSPWSLDGGKKIGFISLSHKSGEPVAKLRPFLDYALRFNNYSTTV